MRDGFPDGEYFEELNIFNEKIHNNELLFWGYLDLENTQRNLICDVIPPQVLYFMCLLPNILKFIPHCSPQKNKNIPSIHNRDRTYSLCLYIVVGICCCSCYYCYFCILCALSFVFRHQYFRIRLHVFLLVPPQRLLNFSWCQEKQLKLKKNTIKYSKRVRIWYTPTLFSCCCVFPLFFVKICPYMDGPCTSKSTLDSKA